MLFRCCAALYPEGLTQTMQWTLGILALAVNALVYWRIGRHRFPSKA